MHRKYLVLLIVMALALTQAATVLGQQTMPLNCGDIVEVETTRSNPYFDFQIQANAGVTINARIEPVGQSKIITTLYDATGQTSLLDNEYIYIREPGTELALELVLPASNPVLAVGLWDRNAGPVHGGYAENFGAFTIYLGCTLRDGTVIAPGDTAVASGAGDAPQTVLFSGFGFPGLSPVDFTNAIAIPFQMGDLPNVGSIAPGFDSVFGFSFEGSAGDTFALDFTRLSGNMSLNLTVLSVNNEVAYQASLVTSSSMSSTFTLPSSGTYTVGVSRSTVGAPASPENTTFQLTGALNSTKIEAHG